MKTITRVVFLDDEGEKFFGEGPYRLLKGVKETGSLHQAALEMEMSYSKAMKILKKAEQVIGSALTFRETGGISGGGSRLTATGEAWLQRYSAYRDACVQANRELYEKFFTNGTDTGTGCVIMASGLGRRFGGNKLMADFNGEPMIGRCLKATEGIRNRVVVTRNRDVMEYCEKRGVKTVFHDLPHRNDTVRLGLEALEKTERCLFVPADQPLLTGKTVETILLTGDSAPEKIIRPCHGQEEGSPVLFPARFYEELRNLPESKGGGFVVAGHPDQVLRVPVQDPLELKDADTPEELEQLKISGRH